MINSRNINNQQNQAQLLKIQYAARKSYNAAEKSNYLSWVFCLLSALFVFIPDSITDIITIGMPAFLDLAALFTAFLFRKKLKNAADLRAYFDSKVLFINEDSYTAKSEQKLKEIATLIFQKNPVKANICIYNTGRDVPPGVYNWYEFKQEKNGVEAQYECQRQNIWWNKRIAQKRLVYSLIALVGTLIILGVVFCVFRPRIWIVIACMIPVVIRMIERLVEHAKYYTISVKIDAVQDIIETGLTIDGIEKLQGLIDERRRTAVLEVNFIHRKNAKKLSALYEETS